MSLTQQIKTVTAKALADLYQQNWLPDDILVNATKPEFSGDYTVVLFALVKTLRANPETVGQTLGTKLVSEYPDLFKSFNVIKGFLNLEIPDR